MREIVARETIPQTSGKRRRAMRVSAEASRSGRPTPVSDRCSDGAYERNSHRCEARCSLVRTRGTPQYGSFNRILLCTTHRTCGKSRFRRYLFRMRGVRAPNGKAIHSRMTMLPWFVGLQQDHSGLEVPEGGTWEDLRTAHADMILGPRTHRAVGCFLHQAFEHGTWPKPV